MTFIKKPEGFFLCITLLAGGVLLLVIPPLQTPDEASHFLRSYQISQFEFTPVSHGGALGGEMPKSLSKTIELLDTKPSLRFHAETKYDIHRTAAALHIPLNKQDTTFTNGVTSYTPFAYIPQAIGIFIGSLFNLPPVVLMYMARLANLFVWAGLIFAAIKIAPIKKWAFVGLGLLPMLVAQGISPGIDAISVGFGVLFITVVLKYYTEQKIYYKKWMTLLILGCLIGLTKQTTVLVLGLVFLLSTNRFDTTKWKAIAKKSLIVILPIVILASWTLLVGMLNLGGSSGIEGQSSSGQVSLLMHHPWHFVCVLFDTFFTTWGDDIIRSFVGNFGWADTPLAAGFVNLGYIFIASILFINYESFKKPLTKMNKYLIVSLVLLFILGTCGALYVLYSPVNYPIIYGLQGRYFLLFLFMLVPLLASFNLKIAKSSYVKLISFGSVSLLVISVVTIFLRYYVTLF